MTALCISCNDRPRLGPLKRCIDCLKADVERNRLEWEKRQAAKLYADPALYPPPGKRHKCGAKTRAGHPCRATAMKKTNRCRHHGGLSTGPTSPEGKARATLNLRNTPSWKRHAEKLAAASRA
jgi:hypothetical protein